MRVRRTTAPVRRVLLPSCGGTPSCSCWGAVTARQEAAPDRGRRLTNVCSSTTDPSVANPACPDGLPEEPSDELSRPQLLWPQLTILRALWDSEPTTHFVIVKNKQRHSLSFLSDPLVPARLFNAKLSHFVSLHETQGIYAFVVFSHTFLEKAHVSQFSTKFSDWPSRFLGAPEF